MTNPRSKSTHSVRRRSYPERGTARAGAMGRPHRHEPDAPFPIANGRNRPVLVTPTQGRRYFAAADRFSWNGSNNPYPTVLYWEPAGGPGIGPFWNIPGHALPRA